MNKIEVTNTAIIINDYNMGDCEKLERQFSIYDPVTHKKYIQNMYYDEENKMLYLPRGIDIWFVEKLFDTRAHFNINAYYKYQKFNDIKMRTKPRNETQAEAFRFMVGLNEYKDTELLPQLSLNLNTGKGKTYVSVLTLAYLGIRGIIIAKLVDWLQQWADKIMEYTNIKENEICIIKGSNVIYRLLNMSDEQLSKYKIFLVTHDTIQSFASNNGWESVGELFKFLKIGIKVYDESHLDFNNICMIDYHTNVFKTYYVTATPGRSGYKENIIYQNCFKNIPSITLHDPEADAHTDYYSIHYNSNPTPSDISSCRNNTYGLDRNKYTKYLLNKPNFYKLLTIIMDIALKNTKIYGQKCLIYIGTNEAIQTVYQWIIENFQDIAYDVGIYTSIIPKKEKAEALNKRIILSTTKSTGAASDIPGLRLTIVLAEPFKSEIIARQTFGRTRENNTKYIEVVDRGFNQCVKYYYEKQPVYKSIAKNCYTIRMSQTELNDKCNKINQFKNNKIVLLEKI